MVLLGKPTVFDANNIDQFNFQANAPKEVAADFCQPSPPSYCGWNPSSGETP